MTDLKMCVVIDSQTELTIILPDKINLVGIQGLIERLKKVLALSLVPQHGTAAHHKIPRKRAVWSNKDHKTVMTQYGKLSQHGLIKSLDDPRVWSAIVSHFYKFSGKAGQKKERMRGRK